MRRYGSVERVQGESSRPPYTPEGFVVGLGEFEAELTPKFIDAASTIPELSEAAIILAISEFGRRLRIMGQCVQPRTAPHNIGLLFSSIDIASAWPRGSAFEDQRIQNIDELGYGIVHSPDIVREVMESHRLITHRGLRLLKKEDRESSYYRLPVINAENLEPER
jgi:hypothetical protein